MPRAETSKVLRQELEERIRSGRCAYCRRPARPESPLTREHVIPRARGGRRKDIRIIVPACARCNHRRGCQELVLFLLGRPRRISAFLDYLCSLSPESVQGMDLRVFAELCTAVWLLNESSTEGSGWRRQLQRLCSGRTLHRRRYAARRVVGALAGRLESQKVRGRRGGAPSCLVPEARGANAAMHLEEPLDQLSSRLLGVLSLLWQVSAEDVRRELERHFESADGDGISRSEPAGVVAPLDGWNRRTSRRRLPVDRRRGRPPPRIGGRAA